MKAYRKDGRLVIEISGEATGRVVADDAAPECTCAAKDMTFGRCCKLTPNKCKWCGRMFATAEALSQHKRDAHSAGLSAALKEK